MGGKLDYGPDAGKMMNLTKRAEPLPHTMKEQEMCIRDRSIPLVSSMLNDSFRCLRIRLRETLKRVQSDKQAARHEISPNVFDVHHGLL